MISEAGGRCVQGCCRRSAGTATQTASQQWWGLSKANGAAKQHPALSGNICWQQHPQPPLCHYKLRAILKLTQVHTCNDSIQDVRLNQGKKIKTVALKYVVASYILLALDDALLKLVLNQIMWNVKLKYCFVEFKTKYVNIC